MMEAGIPEHLMLHLAKGVHTRFMKDSFQQIQNQFSPFERLFYEEDIDSIYKNLTKYYPDVEVLVQNDFLCGEHITVVLKLTKFQFIVFHEYKEYGTYEQFLMEGTYSQVENEKTKHIYTMNSFIWKDMWKEETVTMHTVEQYRQKKNRNHIPFNFLHWAMTGLHNMIPVKFHDTPKKHTWFNANKIIDWFLSIEDDLLELVPNPQDLEVAF